jgi:dipeptidyl aminopeptidase/acylaminoacyl peptidase
MAADTGTDPMDPDTREARLLGAPLPAVPDAAAQASPVTHVSAGAPPLLLLHGSADRLVPCAQSERLHTALREAGVHAELALYPGADHMWAGSPAAAQRALQETISALASVLLPDR